jgi:hypothetical protein
MGWKTGEEVEVETPFKKRRSMGKSKVVSDRDKSIIVALTKAGVTSQVVANAFGIPRQAVAAFKAWDTIRG